MIYAADNVSVNGYVTKISGLINGNMTSSKINDCRKIAADLMKMGMGLRLYIVGIDDTAMHCIVTDDKGHAINDLWGVSRSGRLVNGKYFVREGHEHSFLDILYNVPVREFLEKYTQVKLDRPPTRTVVKSGRVVR